MATKSTSLVPLASPRSNEPKGSTVPTQSSRIALAAR